MFTLLTEGTDRATIHGSKKDLIFELHSRLPFVQKDVITQVVSKLATDMAGENPFLRKWKNSYLHTQNEIKKTDR